MTFLQSLKYGFRPCISGGNAWAQPGPLAFSPEEQRLECTPSSPASSWSEKGRGSADFTTYVLRPLTHQIPGPVPRRKEARRVPSVDYCQDM